MKRYLGFTLVCVLIVSGCNRAKENVNAKSNPEADADTLNKTTIVSASSQTGINSPAKMHSELTIESLPDEVCKAFVRNLQEGNVLTAEKLLTRKAMALTRKFELNFGPSVGPGASCNVGEPQYATSKQNIALVPCQISNSAADDRNADSFSFMLRRNTSGWKIAGILMTQSDGNLRNLFSFENADDVVELRDMFENEVTDIAPVRHATNDQNLK